ncbi:helix-turn-helix transcriptional regulator [Agromyces aureus]|uniref:helix-turn-helix transcriptional regulator n=1 Tax=Agromyces aureus TaxID=453304 RepID=UPI000A4746BF|nr:LuxR C-terminal-related transcriptional regulator [Agromyces aureus]
MPEHIVSVAVGSHNGLLRAALVDLISAKPHFLSVASCGTVAEVRKAVIGRQPDLIVVGSEVVDAEEIVLLLRLHRGLQVLMLGTEPTRVRVLTRTRSGIAVPESATPAIFLKALNVFSPTKQAAVVLPDKPDSPILSGRQLEVLSLAASGRSNGEIAIELGIREGTVKRHLFDAFRVLSARSRLDAVNRARALGHAL